MGEMEERGFSSLQLHPGHCGNYQNLIPYFYKIKRFEIELLGKITGESRENDRELP